MFDRLIFDFDGTVSDSYPIFTEAFLRVLANRGIPGDYDKVFSQLKVSVGYAFRQYDFGGEGAEANREFHEYRNEIALQKGKLVPGMEELLAYTSELGCKNYIYTHTDAFVYRFLEKLGVSRYFAYVLDGSRNFPLKPNPEALNFLCRECGIDRNRALMIGDRDIDILAGKNAGIRGCLLDELDFYPRCESDFRIRRPEELKAILKQG